MTVLMLLRKPGAFVPLLMSLAALALIAGVVATVGITPSADEQAPARIFQLLIGLQVPVAAAFAIRWLSREPKAAITVLAAQVAAALLPVAIIAWLQV